MVVGSWARRMGWIPEWERLAPKVALIHKGVILVWSLKSRDQIHSSHSGVWVPPLHTPFQVCISGILI